MSAPPSPRIGHSTKRTALNNTGDRVSGLHLPDEGRKVVSDGEVRYERTHHRQDERTEESQQFNLNISIASDQVFEPEQPISRSTSATSSLDPYYFGLQSESESPMPPLPPAPLYLSTTPDHPPLNEPVTPMRNPAAIDRRGLVGVGELATPRWAREESSHEQDSTSDIEGYDVVVPDNVEEEEDQPDSPWTIEAIDGESSDKEEVLNTQPEPRTLRSKPSIADESGGEEILYPRNGTFAELSRVKLGPRTDDTSEALETPQASSHTRDASSSMSPPSAFNQSNRKARKRSSDEFEMDQTGSLTSKHTRSLSASKDKSKDEKTPPSRKHRSLNISLTASKDIKGKDRRRESVGLTFNNNFKVPASTVKSPERHVRQASASSTSSNPADNLPSRRVHTTDFSRLPPSPSSSSIQQFLRNSSVPSASQSSSATHRSSKDNLHSSHVAHSILRGTQQEGWTPDDETIRKMDGAPAKGARTRSSVGSLVNSSRPGTPANKAGIQWEGVSALDPGKSKRSSGDLKDGLTGKDKRDSSRSNAGNATDNSNIAETSIMGFSSDEQAPMQSHLDKTPKKSSAGARLSFTPKRGSTSSTTYASTPSSRDSASMSATTSVTSMSANSGRQSSNKARRNSAGSDVSSVHSLEANLLKERGGSNAANGEGSEENNVPPVPPLPKDLSTYRSPPTTSSSLSFPSLAVEDKEKSAHFETQTTRTISLEVPPYTSPVVSPPTSSSGRRESQYYSSTNESAPPPVLKTPSKKWSFLKLSGSPSSSQKSSFPLSPRSVTFGQQLRKSTSKEHPTAPSSAKVPWSPSQPDAMVSAGSLTSLSSVGSIRATAEVNPAKTPERAAFSARSEAESGDQSTSALSAPPTGPLSPSSSIRRAQSKRLTPSSIPFFRRSSSQSMQLPPPNGAFLSSSPPFPGMLSANHPPPKTSSSPSHDYNSISTSTPGTTHKKPSMFSLLKSSSRRSLHADTKDATKEAQKAKDSSRESDKEKAKLEKERQKKEDKDRSESRISVIINRKRGKTLSSAEPRKPKSPINLPPMQISALEPMTAHRVAKLKSSANATPTASPSSRTSLSSTSSRLTSQTVSSMQKQSDSSLRSRHQLPTIAGSPSVGTVGTNSSQTLKDHREPPSLSNSTSGFSKDTPTKIPRISSRTSAAAPSPPLKQSSSALATRRASGLVVSSSTNASPTSLSTNEFGVIESEDGATPKVRQTTIQPSPAASTSRVQRQPVGTASTVNSTPRKPNRDSVSFIGLRKSSTNSVASLSTPASANETTHHRFSSVLSPSKGLKLLAPKSSARASTAGATPPVASSPSSSRQSLSTPSPVPSTVDEEELLGDEEMLHYIRRQHAKRLAAGASQEELDEMLKFPEPEAPTPPSSPAAILKSHQAQYLSEYEKKEIFDYPSVYCIGANSKKKMAVPDISTNNYGYDDERGDYLIVNHDHLAYRYEVIDTLGKGSFGQVLNCRDHATGESVAIKIIRNKKRFHHQALVEIKILDNLRKWDADEKHHVIKMTEHFYFRNHLCIAMELLSINLYELIKANGFVGFTTALIRRFTSQMLLSLSLMRHHRIVHCDLKPENVLLRHPAKSGIKVIDFGSSCFEHEKIYTYIQSRFYRSPEVILGMNYHMAIDMWSLGCILAELYTGFPIFPGENEQEQLSCIMEVLGVPDKDFINRSSRRKLFFEPNGAPRTVINSKGRKRRPGTKTLAQVLRCNDEEFVDFIAKCLIWDPERRMKPQAAMRHPFLTSGRKARPSIISKSAPSSSSLSARKPVTETPKKSLISAPTPLTARSSRTTAATSGGLTTPSTSYSQLPASSSTQTSRTYRSSQNPNISAFNSSRTLSGYVSSTNK
ncbi:hypothetical protein D9613_002862 [Agrocybe pediades]|uniref:dual-specificity kinase n=1 Tax=Agrocybe pediades TaxID=84607 RepID=A0A8H4QQ37_9AGAR|nr:hypothetical protein D9613_002862 [Agrocybe pediades]